MSTGVRNLSRAAVVVAVTVWAGSVGAQVPVSKGPLIVGIWALNPQKSHMRVTPDYVEIRQYTMRPDGFLVGLLVTGGARGYHYLQFTAKSDGREYPEYTDRITADMIAAGKSSPRTYAETIVNDYVTEWTDRANGVVTAKGKKIVSPDGKTLTVTVDGSSAPPHIYDRQ